MKTLIYFNANDKPENVGQSQLVDSIQTFIDERRDLFIDVLIQGNVLSYTKAISEDNEVVRGYAMIFEVPDDFQN